jgi:hypothetical protein
MKLSVHSIKTLIILVEEKITARAQNPTEASLKSIRQLQNIRGSLMHEQVKLERNANLKFIRR